MKQTNLYFVLFFSVFLFLGSLVGWLFQIGINRPPLKYADIPLQTADWINSIAKKVPDQGISVKEQGPFKWDNDDDYGNKMWNDTDWSKEEDANFIVYYIKDKESRWQGWAKDVLQEANTIIPELTSLMGKYLYPDDMNGRKLPIYLATTPELYQTTVNELMGSQNNAQGSVGIIITEVGPLGCLTHGIVLHPNCFGYDHLNGYRKVLRHEMNHYVFFSLLNYEKNINHYLWMSEGLAEYFCDRHDQQQVSGADSVRFINENCLLDNEFPLEKNSAYWAGESFFRYMEKTKGKKFVKQFIDSAYNYSTDSTFIVNLLNTTIEHQKWIVEIGGSLMDSTSTLVW